jgi:hypothetical protein
VQGWSTNWVACAHRNRIVPYQIGVVLQGNVWPARSVFGLSPLVKLRRGVLNYITKRRRNWIKPMWSIVQCPWKDWILCHSSLLQIQLLKILETPPLEMMRSMGPSNSICFFWIGCMSEGKKVKLAFHAMVANYCGKLAMSSIIFYVATCLTIGSMFT